MVKVLGYLLELLQFECEADGEAKGIVKGKWNIKTYANPRLFGRKNNGNFKITENK